MILAKSWIFQLFPFNTRPLSWCEKWFHMEIFYCLKSWGRSSEAKNINKKFAEWPLSWDMSHYDKKTEKTEKLPKVGGLTPTSVYVDMKSICWKISLFFKNVPKPKHIGNELTMTKQRWTESSCVLCKLVSLIPVIWHI